MSLQVSVSKTVQANFGKEQNGTDVLPGEDWQRFVINIKKGSQVYIEGPIQTNQWEDKNGQKRYTTEIKALTMQMLDSKGSSDGGGDDSYNRGSGGSGVSSPSSGGNQSKPNQPVDFSGDDFDDDELPF